MKRLLPYVIVILVGVLIGALGTCSFYKRQVPETRTETVTIIKSDTVYVEKEGSITPPIPAPIEIPDLDNSIIIKYESYDRDDFMKVRRYNIPVQDSVIKATIGIDAVGFVENIDFSYKVTIPTVTNTIETTTTTTEVYYKAPFPIWGGIGVRTNLAETSFYPKVGLHLKGLTVYYGYDPFNNFHMLDTTVPLNKIF